MNDTNQAQPRGSAIEDLGQSIDAWSAFWDGLTPEREIRMWDFYGGRPWVMKHAPRHGKLVEAGCGLGRYVFLLSRLGIDIEGLDLHEPTIERLRTWAMEHAFGCTFRVGDVKLLPYADESLSGYLSFGVIEHFQEGPQAPLAEAYRVLRPGGIAIISTPAPSFSQRYFRARRAIKTAVKRVIRWPVRLEPFFQYWYTPGQLGSLVAESGLQVVLAGGADLKYAAWELGAGPTGRALAFRLADHLEATPLRALGAQALIISIKLAERMYCFLCGELAASAVDLQRFYMPVCGRCALMPVARYYRTPLQPRFAAQWSYPPADRDGICRTAECGFCGTAFFGDPLFDSHHGFSVPICPSCLLNPVVNLVASNEHLLPVWRPRGKRLPPR